MVLAHLFHIFLSKYRLPLLSNSRKKLSMTSDSIIDVMQWDFLDCKVHVTGFVVVNITCKYIITHPNALLQHGTLFSSSLIFKSIWLLILLKAFLQGHHCCTVYFSTCTLELAKHITPHINGEPLLKWSSSHSHSSPVLQRFCLSSDLLTATIQVLLLPMKVPRSISYLPRRG